MPWLASVLCQIGLLGLPAPGPREVPADALDATVAAQSEAHAARVAWRQALAAAHYRRDDPAVGGRRTRLGGRRTAMRRGRS